MLNCKKGDLAVIVRSDGQNLGKVVQCVEFFPAQLFMEKQGFIVADAWEIDRMLTGVRGGLTNIALDSQLRPIRDNDGEDETLQWKAVPKRGTRLITAQEFREAVSIEWAKQRRIFDGKA